MPAIPAVHPQTAAVLYQDTAECFDHTRPSEISAHMFDTLSQPPAAYRCLSEDFRKQQIQRKLPAQPPEQQFLFPPHCRASASVESSDAQTILFLLKKKR